MDYSGFSLPTNTDNTAQYDYQDDGLGAGAWADDGLGTGYGQPDSSAPGLGGGGLDEDPEDYFDTFGHEEQPNEEENKQQQQPGAASSQQLQQQAQQQQTTPAGSSKKQQQPADEAAAAGGGGAADEDDDELAAALDEEMFKPAGAAAAAAAAASKSQQGGGDEDMSDAETIDDEGLGAMSTDTASRDNSAQPEDPAQAEQHKQNAWFKECYDAMTEAQRNRLEAFKTSNLQKKSMKKVVQELTGLANPNDKLLVGLCSVSKMFVGELVSTARQIAACQGHTGALLPSHIRAAYQVLTEDGKVPHNKVPSKPLRLR